MYGGPFIQVYGAWIKAEVIRQGFIDANVQFNKTIYKKIWRDAENKVREIVGVSNIGEKFFLKLSCLKPLHTC